MTPAKRKQSAARVRRYRAAHPAREADADLLAANLYLLDGLSIKQTGAAVDLSATEMRRRLASQGVPLRSRGRPRKEA